MRDTLIPQSIIHYFKSKINFKIHKLCNYTKYAMCKTNASKWPWLPASSLNQQLNFKKVSIVHYFLNYDDDDRVSIQSPSKVPLLSLLCCCIRTDLL